MKKLLSIILAVSLCLLTAACAGDEDFDDSKDPDETSSSAKDPVGGSADIPPDMVNPSPLGMFNPLTGLYDLTEDSAARPVAVIVNNYRYSRWQSGLLGADIIFETIGGNSQTQLACLYADISGLRIIGPVDHIYDNLACAVFGIDPVVVHHGFPEDYPNNFLSHNPLLALDGEQIASLVFVDEERSKEYILEYSVFTDGERINSAMPAWSSNTWLGKMPFDFISPDAPAVVPSDGAARNIYAGFTGIYDFDFRFNPETGRYHKYQFLFPHTDTAAGHGHLAFENVFILFSRFNTEESSGELRYIFSEADLSAGGQGYYFFGGGYERISWKQQDGALAFFDGEGRSLTVNTGKSYIAIIDEDNEYTLTITE